MNFDAASVGPPCGIAGHRCDVLVAGGGPAGLSASIALRQRGLDVLLADALVPPIDKACGEGLMPDARQELARMGIQPAPGTALEFAGIHFAAGDRSHTATADFPQGGGIGIRRLELHRLLVERAVSIGVRLHWGTRVDLHEGAVALNGEACAYRFLVGADGEASRVRRWAGLESGSVLSKRLGFRRHYRMPPSISQSETWAGAFPENGHVQVHWGASGQVYITPVAEDEVCVAAITRNPGRSFDAVLAELPWLQANLLGLQKTGRDRGAVSVTRVLDRVTRGNVALVGDASGSIDAITGEGLALAFRQAFLLADALAAGTLKQYEMDHRRIVRLPRTMSGVMLEMDRSASFRNRVLRMLAGSPELFARLLDVHTGQESLAAFTVRSGPKLFFRYVAPRNTISPGPAAASDTLFPSKDCRASSLEPSPDAA